jgi:hypothetical protein
VLVAVIAGFCDLSLVGATATVSLGVVGDLTGFIANTTATEVDTGEGWVSATPEADLIAVPTICKDMLIINGANIVVHPLTANVTGGTLRIEVFWLPMSVDGDVSPA